MQDKIEIEYWIAECDRFIKEVEEMPGREQWDAKIKSLKRQKKEIEAELKEVKEKLAHALTSRGAYDEAIQKYQDARKDLEAELPNVLTEQDSVAVLKKVRESGKYHFESGRYRAGSYPDAERFWKAVYTLGGTVGKDINHEGDEYIVLVTKFDTVYREFLYGTEEE